MSPPIPYWRHVEGRNCIGPRAPASLARRVRDVARRRARRVPALHGAPQPPRRAGQRRRQARRRARQRRIRRREPVSAPGLRGRGSASAILAALVRERDRHPGHGARSEQYGQQTSHRAQGSATARASGVAPVDGCCAESVDSSSGLHRFFFQGADPGAVIVDGVMVVVGVSHETAGLAARERVALDDLGARGVLRGLRHDPAVSEVVVLSTCNRTEIYALAASPQGGEAAVRRALLEHTEIGAATLACSGYALFELAAAEHLFRVAAGLESAILGETEISGQVRAAARRAREERTLGPLLSGAFERSLTAARRVRQRTRISAGAVSLAS